MLFEGNLWIPGEAVWIRIECSQEALNLGADLFVSRHLALSHLDSTHFTLHSSGPLTRGLSAGMAQPTELRVCRFYKTRRPQISCGGNSHVNVESEEW